MTRKMTVTEAVERISMYINSERAMRDVLMECTRATMLEVLKAVTKGEKRTVQASTNAGTAERVISQIQDWRKTEEYRALPYEEKYTALLSADVVKQSWYVDRMTLAELRETARRIGAPVKENEYPDWAEYYCKDGILAELEAIRQVEAIDGKDWHHDRRGLMSKLESASCRTLSMLVEKAGLEVEVRESYYNTEAKEALMRY